MGAALQKLAVRENRSGIWTVPARRSFDLDQYKLEPYVPRPEVQPRLALAHAPTQPPNWPPCVTIVPPISPLIPLQAPVAAASVRLASPWARLWSRLLDLVMWQYAIYVTIKLAVPAMASDPVFSGPHGAEILGMSTLPLAVVADGVTQGVFGCTPGRWLAGIRVETADHAKPSLWLCVRRGLSIYLEGLALGIPQVCLIAPSLSYRKVRSGKPTSWDTAFGTRVYDRGATFWRTAAVAALFSILAIAAVWRLAA